MNHVRLSLVAVALAAAIPAAASAQAGPPMPRHTPSPAMLQARETARAASLNDLSPEHRAQVQSIVDQVNAGTLTDVRAAADQIEALLTPAERAAVLAEGAKMRTAMHQAMGGPAGGPPHAQSARAHHGARRGPRAGRLLLQLNLSPERMRALRRGMERPGGAERPPQ